MQADGAARTGSRNLWFVIDRLPPMPVEELRRAGEQLVAGLAHFSPGITHSIELLAPTE